MIRPFTSSVAEPVAEALDPTPAPGRSANTHSSLRDRRRWLRFVLLSLPTIIAIGGGYYYLRPARSAPNAATTAFRSPAVVGLGFLEPASTVVKIGAPGSPDALRVGELKISEGDEVEAGQILATLDTAAKLAAQAQASEAQLKLKLLLLEKQQVEIASNLTSRQSALERAQAELMATTTDYDRQKTLLDRGVTTVANLEKKQRELLTGQATVREMEAALQRIQAVTKSSVAAPGTLIDIAVTEQEVAAAEADLKVARAGLEQAIIRAPFRGRVLSLKTRAGERIGVDGLLEMGATQNMRAVIEVYQTDVGRVRIGQFVTIRASVLAKPIIGVVERISPTVRRQSVVNNDPATSTDSRVVEAFVTLDEVTSGTVATLSRLQVQGVFQP